MEVRALPSKLLKWWLVALMLGMLSTGVALAMPSDEAQLQQIYLQGMQGGTGGTYGYYVKQVGGPVVVNNNDGHVYDPASALKTLYLAYAMRQVASGAESLTNPVTVYKYPNSRNAGGNPLSPGLCPNPADEVPANAVTQDLQTVLRGMMVTSDNRHTRAIELRYGRANLNGLASSLGMSNTRLDQILGCAHDNGQRNSWTLADAGRLYEGISAGTGVPASVRDQLYSVMITTRPAAAAYADVVATETSSLGISDAATSFVNETTGRLKGGSYNICYGPCSAGYVITRDEAGVLTVPFQSPSGVAPRDFVFGSFITELGVQCSGGFPCEAANRANTAMDAAVPEMFRPVVREALQSWSALTRLTAATATSTRRGVKVKAQLRTVYGAKRPAGMLIRFKIGGRPLCKAKTNTSGTAACTGKPRGRVVRYTASFAGGGGLFPANANGRVLASKK